nr:uncharacterized protein LOC105759311 isoform X2 [Taeniopygia guttata]
MVAPRAGLPGAARDAPRQVRPRRRAQRCRGSSEGRGQRVWHSPCSGTEGRTSKGHGNFFSDACAISTCPLEDKRVKISSVSFILQKLN